MNVNDLIKVIVVLGVTIAFLAIVFAPIVQGQPIPENIVVAVIGIFTALLGAGGSIGLVNWGEQRALRATRVQWSATSMTK